MCQMAFFMLHIVTWFDFKIQILRENQKKNTSNYLLVIIRFVLIEKSDFSLPFCHLLIFSLFSLNRSLTVVPSSPVPYQAYVKVRLQTLTSDVPYIL